MRFRDDGNGFCIWLSSRDTYGWAHTPGAQWPCSELSGRRIFAAFDTDGLVDMSVDGKSIDVDATEFNAIVADHAARCLSKLHPCYFVAVGQFRGRE